MEATRAGIRRVRLPDNGAPLHSAGRDDAALANAERAVGQLEEYFRGNRKAFEVVLDWTGVDPTHHHVLETLDEIALYGSTVTYGELGRRAGIDDPRDVGVMMSRNPLPLVIPCHRVVASDGLGGYGGGVDLKRRLLELEGVLPPRLELDV